MGRLRVSRSLCIGLDRQESLHVQFAIAPAGVPADAGAAILLPQTELTPEKLAQLIRSLDRAKLLDMANKARALGKPDAARIVAQRCMEIAR